MAGVTFSEAEVKKLILALAGSKAPVKVEEEPEMEDSEEKDSEEKPEEKDEKPEGKPFGKDAESTKAMLEKKLKGEKDA